jgi:Fur family ferric uptake transcriptional regulator
MKYKKSPSENVSLIFSKYLKSKGLRQTPERFAILSEIYLSDTHFSLQALGERLTKKKFFVSRGTLYNTVELLLDCGLIRRYQLEGNRTRYEKTKNTKSYDYLVLSDTKEVLEFSDEQLSKIQKNIEKLFNVKIYDHSLIFYGRRKTNEHPNNEKS